MGIYDGLSNSWARFKTWVRETRLWAVVSSWRPRRVPENDVTHSLPPQNYPGSRRREYVVHHPPGKTGKRARPLVVVLHGCRQDHRDIEQITGFNELADRHDFLVAYPNITSYSGMRDRNCWGWWFAREIRAGAGEVEDLWQIVEDIKRRYTVDERRIHVTGLSAGGGMAVAMLVAHADKIASGAAVAGLPYAETANTVRHALNNRPRYRPVVAIVRAMRAEMGELERAIPLQIVHSRHDDKVEIEAARLLRDSWGHCFGINTRQAQTLANGEIGDTTWERRCYRGDRADAVVETLFLDGPGHGWYGGNPGRYSYPEAPDIKRDIWKFFVAHPLERRKRARDEAA